MANKAPGNQHSWETQGFQLGLLILTLPAKCLLPRRGCVRMRKEQGARLVAPQLVSAGYCV